MTPPAFGPGPVLSLAAPRPYGGESHNKRRTCAATLLCADFDTPHRVPLLCGIFDVPEPKSLWIHDKLYASHQQKANKKNRLQTPQIQYIIARTLGHSLTVELRTLTPSVLVRIQLPQPRIQPALCGFNYWSEVMVQQCNDCCFGSTMSRFDKPAQSNRHECPAGHIFIYARGNQLRPAKNSTRLVRV